MHFLEALGPAHRSVLEQNAQVLALPRGEYLIRRGEPGGDVYLLQSGLLEAVDGRASPELILNTLVPGAMVGEMAFLDDSPRSVDVRACADAVVLRWPRIELHDLLAKHPEIASTFYESVAKLAVTRVRFLTEGAAVGGFGNRDQEGAGDADQARSWSERVAERVKAQLPLLELALHRATDERPTIEAIRRILDTLEQEVDSLFEALPDPPSRNAAATLLRRELHPYLLRSALAERSIRRPEGEVAAAEVLAHVLVDTEAGDGRLGEIVDRWLLDRPTFRALRAARDTMTSLVLPLLPRHRNRRVLVVTVGTGSIVATLAQSLASPPTVITVLDQREDALALVRGDRWKGVEIRTLHESLTRFALGQTQPPLPPQDAVFLHGILEYLPERMAVSLLRTVQRCLTDDGVVALATLGPSRDQTLLDRLLAWPTLRRTDELTEALARAAGLLVQHRAGLAGPAQVALLVPDLAGAQTRSD